MAGFRSLSVAACQRSRKFIIGLRVGNFIQYYVVIGFFIYFHRLTDDVEYAVFCTAVAQGNSTTWVYLMERYKSSECEREKKDILKALACTNDTELTNR